MDKKIIHAHSISGGMNNPPEVEQRLNGVELTGRVTDPEDEVLVEVDKKIHFRSPLFGSLLSGKVVFIYKEQVVVEMDSLEIGIINKSKVLTNNEYKTLQEINALNDKIQHLKDKVKELSK